MLELRDLLLKVIIIIVFLTLIVIIKGFIVSYWQASLLRKRIVRKRHRYNI